MKKNTISCLLATALAFSLICGCTEAEKKDAAEKAEDVVQEISDQAENMLDSEDEHVIGVKTGHPNSYPNITYGDAFDNFFATPTWKYFEGENGEDVVEFTGYCTYQDVEVKARLQFILEEDGTITYGAMSFNDVPQTNLITISMLEAAFEDYMKDNGISAEDVDNTDDSDVSGTNEEAKSQSEDQPDTFSADLSFPIMYLGYTDEYSPCPVMVNEDVSGVAKNGTYEEMMESLVDDGTTMYATPAMEGKVIYTATKWDAPSSEWYNGLLTYEQFLNTVAFMSYAYEDNGTEHFTCGGSWDDVGALAGRWSGGGQEIAISIYSDSDYYNAFDEIGTISVEGQEGNVYLFGKGNDAIYVLCSINGGGEWMLRYHSNGKFDIWRASEESPVTSGMEFECIESFMS